MLSIAMMANGGRLDMKKGELNQEQIEELYAIFMLNNPGKNKKRALVWESALGDHELGGYQIIPLTNSRALRQEGRAMHHCVGGYDERCAHGRARVFSIRDLMGKRLATMSLVFKNDYWQLEQIKGVANEEVCISEEIFYDGERTVTQLDVTDFHYIACDVLRRYRKDWEKGLLELIVDAAKAGGLEI
jgi:hypothetical protein